MRTKPSAQAQTSAAQPDEQRSRQNRNERSDNSQENKQIAQHEKEVGEVKHVRLLLKENGAVLNLERQDGINSKEGRHFQVEVFVEFRRHSDIGEEELAAGCVRLLLQ